MYWFKINLQSKQTFYFYYLYLFFYNVVQHDSHIRLCLYRLKVTRRVSLEGQELPPMDEAHEFTTV